MHKTRMAVALTALLGAGCNCGPMGGPDGGGQTSATTCGPRVQGARYALCLQSVSSQTGGTLRSGAVESGVVASKQGALRGARYTLTGGSFHAAQ